MTVGCKDWGKESAGFQGREMDMASEKSVEELFDLGPLESWEDNEQLENMGSGL